MYFYGVFTRVFVSKFLLIRFIREKDEVLSILPQKKGKEDEERGHTWPFLCIQVNKMIEKRSIFPHFTSLSHFPLLCKFIEVNLLQYISMSLSVCALSGQPLKRPMASLKTGHLYEKQAIQKHLNSFPYCPITNQPMSLSDLVEVVSLDTNLLRQDESPVSYFAKIQQEFNVLAVDAFKLRKSLKQTEEQLTHSLYQNEAAQRVIAKLLKEKQDAENEIQKLTNRLSELAN